VNSPANSPTTPRRHSKDKEKRQSKKKTKSPRLLPPEHSCESAESKTEVSHGEKTLQKTLTDMNITLDNLPELPKLPRAHIDANRTIGDSEKMHTHFLASIRKDNTVGFEVLLQLQSFEIVHMGFRGTVVNVDQDSHEFYFIVYSQVAVNQPYSVNLIPTSSLTYNDLIKYKRYFPIYIITHGDKYYPYEIVALFPRIVESLFGKIASGDLSDSSGECGKGE
jgi:hypothetical protein